jgi:hypothetical protein
MRKTATVTITAEGRDKGKMFAITEMSADASERWALRAFFALMNTGIEIPADIAESGMAGIATMGLAALGKLPYYAAEPLLDDMWACVQAVPNPASPGTVRALVDEDIEEVATRLQLRKEVFALHTDFFTAASTSTTGPAPKGQLGS